MAPGKTSGRGATKLRSGLRVRPRTFPGERTGGEGAVASRKSLKAPEEGNGHEPECFVPKLRPGQLEHSWGLPRLPVQEAGSRQTRAVPPGSLPSGCPASGLWPPPYRAPDGRPRLLPSRALPPSLHGSQGCSLRVACQAGTHSSPTNSSKAPWPGCRTQAARSWLTPRMSPGWC